MKGARIIVLLLGTMMMVGCITFKHPKGDWSFPVDLRLESGVLNGAVIAVRCGAGEHNEENWTESILEGCKQAATAVRSLGATVFADQALFPAIALRKAELAKETGTGAQSTEQKSGDSGPKAEESGYVDAKTSQLVPEMTLVYIDRDTKRDRCGWTLPLFILYVGFFPCIEDRTSWAEIRVLDERNILVHQQNLTIETRMIAGVPALYYLGLRWIRMEAYKTERDALADNLYQFLQNTVHAQHLRVRLAKGRSVDG